MDCFCREGVARGTYLRVLVFIKSLLILLSTFQHSDGMIYGLVTLLELQRRPLLSFPASSKSNLPIRAV